jgi:hypothetical protein
MNIPVNDNAFNRRKFLQSGGLALASAAILAACGKSDKVATSYPRIGESPTTTGLPTAHVTDAVLLRTASSLEWCAIDAYTAVAALGLLPSAATSVVKRFQADHKAHAAALTPLIKKAGGEPFECANERINELYIGPAVELITGNESKGIPASDTPVDDLIVLAHGLESLAAATYQYYVSLIATPAVRGAAMTIGQDEARHAAVLAQVIIPDGKGIAPSINETTGKPNPAAVPGAFGSLAAVTFSIGKTSEAGTKTQLSLDTPSLNSLAYEYASC